MKTLLREIKSSVLLTLVFAVLLCGAYPLAVWAGAQALFPAKAGGSLVVEAPTVGTQCVVSYIREVENLSCNAAVEA